MKNVKTYCFDIDNTICSTKGKNYKSSKPNLEAIKKINSKYDKGHKIIIFTGRYMGRNNDNPKKAYKQGYKFTLDQLKNWGLKFHRLHMGKPTFDILVDDKSLGFKKDWYKKI